MATSYKCCKTKEQQNWYCLICKNVFHKSCWLRRNKGHVEIRDNLIWCSRECAEKVTDGEFSVAAELRNIIKDLKVELEEKNTYIKI